LFGLIFCEPLVLRLPLQSPEASHVSALAESQLKVVSSPSLIREADTDRVATGAVSSDGPKRGSEFVPCTTPVPAPAAASAKFSSVLHETRKTEKINAKRVLERTEANNGEVVIDALQLYWRSAE
jgi:hypothetical protein